MADFSIALLESPSEAEQVARWIFAEWGRFEPGMTWDKCLAGVADALTGAAIPRFFVAHRQGALVGCSSIVAADLPTRPELGPWLANVFVLPETRRQGIGTALIQAATDYAAGRTRTLYLYTHDQADAYGRLGWRRIGEEVYAGRTVCVMRRDLAGG